MPAYPLSSQPKRRHCVQLGVVCPTYPCPHTPCHDPDWLDDVEEMVANVNIYNRVWLLYYSTQERNGTSTLKEQLSEEELAFYGPKVERCRRIKDKWDKIMEDMKAHTIRSRIDYMIEEDKLLKDERFKDDPDIIQLRERRRKALLMQTKL